MRSAAQPYSVVVLLLLVLFSGGTSAEVCDPSFTVEKSKEDGSCFWAGGNQADLQLVPQLQQCMEGKTVYIIGTSVSRNWYFQLLKLMEANSTNHWTRSPGPRHYRTRQKAACGGGAEPAKEACRQGGVVFRWQNQNIFDSDLANAMLRGNYDIIIANTGLGNIVHHSRHWQGRVLQQGRQFAEFAATLPSSTRFYWRTTTKICRHKNCRPDQQFRGCGVPDDANAMIEISNIVLPALMQQRDPRVQILDVVPLTNCTFYDDHVHHAHLTVDHLLLFISRECPSLAHSVVTACPHLCSVLLHQQDPGWYQQPVEYRKPFDVKYFL